MKIGGIDYLCAEEIIPQIDEPFRPGIRRVRSLIRRRPSSIALRNRPLLPAAELEAFIREAFACRSSSSGKLAIRAAKGNTRKPGRVARKPTSEATTPGTLISRASKLAVGL
jgi:hypothetical protein